MKTPEIFVVKIGGRIGSKEVTLVELGEKFRLSPETITLKTGVKRLFRFGAGESLVSVTTEVARNVLERVGATKVSGVFASCNTTLQTLMPGYASLVATQLGFRNILADQVGMGCGGGLQALRATYDRLVVDAVRGAKSSYLTIAGDATSLILDDKDRKTGLLFSEGAAVLLVTNDPDLGEDGYQITKINTKSLLGEGINMMTVMNPLHPDVLSNHLYATKPGFWMDGKGVYEFGSDVMPHFLELIEKSKFGSDWMLFPHQPNLRMLEEMARRSGVPKEQIYMEGIQTIGNTSPPAVFLGLQDGLQRNLFDVSNTVVLGAFGAELTVGAAMLKPVGDPKAIVD